MENSKIEWTHHTFNPWWGCVKVSEGCANCYAETFSKRTGNAVWGASAPRRFFGEAHWAQPLKWNTDAERASERKRVFCASMADVFERREDLIAPRRRLFDLIRATPCLDWLLLTKRPQDIRTCVEEIVQDDLVEDVFMEHLPNVWLGTTVENQARANERIPHLLKIPARVHFLSCEPLLGPLNLNFIPPLNPYAPCTTDVLLGTTYWPDGDTDEGPRIDWVIAGGESGAKPRAMEPDWARSLRDQCASDGVPFFFKQWGGRDKAATGRLLDGRTWDEVPTLRS